MPDNTRLDEGSGDHCNAREDGVRTITSVGPKCGDTEDPWLYVGRGRQSAVSTATKSRDIRCYQTKAIDSWWTAI